VLQKGDGTTCRKERKWEEGVIGKPGEKEIPSLPSYYMTRVVLFMESGGLGEGRFSPYFSFSKGRTAIRRGEQQQLRGGFLEGREGLKG